MKYLIDTNILIYFVNGSLNRKQELAVKKILSESFNISIMTKIEFLGWKGHTDEGFKKSQEFINKANIIYLNDSIIDESINLKRNYNIKLVDSIICSTAILNKLKLLTRNIDDFKSIEVLKYFNPFT